MTNEQSVTPVLRRKGTKIFLVSSIVAQISALTRYVVLARLLGPEQLGWAATLIITAQFFDSVSNTGGDRFLIQNDDGDRAEVQGLVHLTAIARGLLTGAAMIVFAIPIARLFNEHVLVVPLMALGLVPVVLGFLHLDMRRLQRHHDFRSEGWSTLWAELVGLAATTVAAVVVKDFTAVLYGLITRALVMVIVSHICAERRFTIAWAPPYVRPLAAFAFPLMVSGLMMFIGGQSDRILVGNYLGPTALGHYSAVLLLILYPSAMVQRYITGIYLPLLSASRRAGASETGISLADGPDQRLAAETLVLSGLMVAGFALVAPSATVLLYGPGFRQDYLLIALLGALQVFRFIRLWPTTEGLAIGRSSIPMVGNLVRMVGLPMAILLLELGRSLTEVIGCFIFGELAAFIVAAIMVNRATGRPLLHNGGRLGLFLILIGAVVTAAQMADVGGWIGTGVAAGASMVILAWIIRLEADGLLHVRDAMIKAKSRLF